MAKIDLTYHALLDKIMTEGYSYEDPHRKGVIRKEILNYRFEYDFADGFPVITTKKIPFKQVVTELLWFLKGDSNIKYLLDNNCNIWNKDVYKYHDGDNIFEGIEEFKEHIKECGDTIGEAGKIYPVQWRGTNKQVDQIDRLIKGMLQKPLATDHIVTTWVADDLKDMALPPCHYSYQIIIKPLQPDFTYGFYIQWNQRSVDTFLGLPFNIASYALLAKMLEKITGYKALGLIGNLNKVHIYDNQFEAVIEQLNRSRFKYDKCELDISDNASYLFEYYTKNKMSNDLYLNTDILFSKLEIDMFNLNNYESYPPIKGVEMLERDANKN